jgi:hypothetical protein
VAKMIHYTFKRESNDFTDILKDLVIKKEIDFQLSWSKHILLGFRDDVPQKILGYIVIKYGEEIVNPFEFDYIPNGIHIQTP